MTAGRGKSTRVSSSIGASCSIVPNIQIGTLPVGVVRSWVGAGNAFATSAAGLAALHAALADFFNKNDISVRLRWWVDGNGVNVKLIANSLADLTRRENRFAHLPILSDRTPPAPLPQYTLATSAIAQALPYDALPRVVYDPKLDRVWMPGTGVSPDARFGFPLDVNRRSVTSLYRAAENVDPGPLRGRRDGVQCVGIRCPGVRSNGTLPARTSGRSVSAERSRLRRVRGSGDRLYDKRDRLRGLCGFGLWAATVACRALLSTFSGGPQFKSHLVLPLANGLPSTNPVYAYCTWSGHYERNGVDDNGDVTQGLDGQWGRAGVDDDGNGVNDNEAEAGSPGSDDPNVDIGTDGFDNDNTNGVDDVGERETSPPYPVPLRGIQVKIRAIDPASRQIRQVTVVSDFIPE